MTNVISQGSSRNGKHNGKLTKMVVDPWSVSYESLDQLAAQLFAASLFPYLLFLYYMGQKRTACPPLANNGFRFLLVFVGATIPAGIYAKQVYHDILANIDWLHGSAESFLTITNLIIVLGFRQGLNSMKKEHSESSTQVSEREKDSSIRASLPTATLLLSGFAAFHILSVIHPEPANALSFPTWIIHVSSLLEWLAAMGLVWQYGVTVGRPQWKGLVWGMLPLHTSGICACTYHLFYNAPALNSLVALQAALTCFGNATMAFATWRIAKSESSPTPVISDESSIELQSPQYFQDSDASYVIKLFVVSAILSIIVKWGSLSLNWPFEPDLNTAIALISVPTALNVLKWAVRSWLGKESFGGLL